MVSGDERGSGVRHQPYLEVALVGGTWLAEFEFSPADRRPRGRRHPTFPRTALCLPWTSGTLGLLQEVQVHSLSQAMAYARKRCAHLTGPQKKGLRARSPARIRASASEAEVPKAQRPWVRIPPGPRTNSSLSALSVRTLDRLVSGLHALVDGRQPSLGTPPRD